MVPLWNMLLLKTVDSRTAKKTCSKNMAQCRELEKMGSVSKTNHTDRYYKKEFKISQV